MKKISIINPVKNIIDILISPGNVFKAINKTPFWLIAYLFIAIGTIFIRLLYFPFIKRIYLVSMPSEYAKAIVQSAKSLTVVSATLAPLYLILKFFIIAIILWFLVQLFTLGTDLKKIFSLVVHCGIITFLGSVLTLLILHLRGLNSVNSAADIQVSLGMDRFLGNLDMSLLFRAFLSSINLFSIWWILLLTFGISITCKISRAKSTSIAVFLWLFSAAFQVGIASLTNSLVKIG